MAIEGIFTSGKGDCEMNKQNGNLSVVEMDFFSKELMEELSKSVCKTREKGQGVTIYEFMEHYKITAYSKAKKILDNNESLVPVKMMWEGTFRPSVVYIKKGAE